MFARLSKKLLIPAVFIFLLPASGCFVSEPKPSIVADESGLVLSPLQEPVTSQYKLMGRSIQGRPLMATILGRGPDTIFILATIHGDEPAGTTLIYSLITYVQMNPQILKGRKIILLPTANPDGAALRSRTNAHGIDLNRNFHTSNRINNSSNGYAGLSEPESQVIDDLIRLYIPDRVISLHQVMNTGPEGLASQFPSGCIDYDGPGLALANYIAGLADMSIYKIGAAPGSLGSYTGQDLKIPTITIELGYRVENLPNDELWNRYGKALIAAINYPPGL
jgi:protein MpaA